MLILNIILPVCLQILYGQISFTDQTVYSNYVYNEKIKTVQLYREGWNLSYPVLKLHSQEKLELHFDLLDDNAETYYYNFIHCDKDWKKSDISERDYIEGQPENPVEEYEPSFNTTVAYFHYKVSFPNDRVSLSLSGNYIIVVYPIDNPEEPVLTQRFMITEDALKIKVTTHRPMMTDNNDSRQQVDFTVSQFGENIIDPYRNFYAFILQNGRWDNAKKNIKPEFYSDNELKYSSLSDKNIFLSDKELYLSSLLL